MQYGRKRQRTGRQEPVIEGMSVPEREPSTPEEEPVGEVGAPSVASPSIAVATHCDNCPA
jgi:hypothetical protein